MRRLRVEQRHQVVGEQPQLLGLGRLPHGLGRVHHRGGIGPPVVGAEQAVERFRGAGEQVGVDPGGEVGVECGEGLPGARGAGDLQRAVEAGEAQPARTRAGRRCTRASSAPARGWPRKAPQPWLKPRSMTSSRVPVPEVT